MHSRRCATAMGRYLLLPKPDPLLRPRPCPRSPQPQPIAHCSPFMYCSIAWGTSIRSAWPYLTHGRACQQCSAGGRSARRRPAGPSPSLPSAARPPPSEQAQATPGPSSSSGPAGSTGAAAATAAAARQFGGWLGGASGGARSDPAGWRAAVWPPASGPVRRDACMAHRFNVERYRY